MTTNPADPDDRSGNSAGTDLPDSSLPDADPRNPMDVILIDGPHHRKSLRLYPPIKNALLLPTNDMNIPSAPFFCEYRPTDRRDQFTGLRIYTYVGIGIDGDSLKASKVNPNPPAPIHPHPKATSYTKGYPRKPTKGSPSS